MSRIRGTAQVARFRAVLCAVLSVLAGMLSVVALASAPAQGADLISFRAAAQSSWNQATARTTIPTAVRAGDAMLLFVTANKAVSVASPPQGWVLEQTRQARTDTVTRLYSRVALASDPGRNATITFDAAAKSSSILLAYDGTASDPIASIASVAETSRSASHTTPASSAATAGSFVVSYLSRCSEDE